MWSGPLPAAGCAGCLGEPPGAGRPAVRGGLPAGAGTGGRARLFAAAAAQTYPGRGPAAGARGAVGVGIFEFRCVPGGCAAGVYAGAVLRRGGVGSHRRMAFAAADRRGLGVCGPVFGPCPGSGQKNFAKMRKISKKSLCICEKMGYNKMELPSEFLAQIRRPFP